jgi:DNA polymerase-3 subunit delta'
MPFRGLVGHRRLIGLLSRSLRGGSLPPSLIFAGPAGVGKRAVAQAAAEALNCLAPIVAPPADAPSIHIDACGACAACLRIARGVHPDVLIVEPGDTGAIKIDAVREIVDRAAYRPFEGRRRVVIVDDADALVVAAQNALLKTLEEPPSGSVFILITARPDVLVATVRSRCPLLRFRPLSADDIASALVARGMDARGARAVAAGAEGSLGRALETSEDEVVAARESASRVLAHAAASTDPRRRIEDAKDLLPRAPAGGAADRDYVAARLHAMTSLLRDAGALAAGASADLLANADLREPLARLAASYRGESLLRAFAAVDRALAALDGNAGAKTVADWLVVNL